MITRVTQLFLAVGIAALALLVALAWLVGPVAAADQCVAPLGAGGCHPTIQAAINAVGTDETVRVVTGVYTENVLITKSLTLLGGCVNSACATRNPRTSTINGGGNGVVISITNGAAVIIDGFTITGGNGTTNNGKGGGISIREATAIIRNNTILGNVASTNQGIKGDGGGILVLNSTTPVGIYNNLVQANTAYSLTLASSVAVPGNSGGGIAIGDASSAIITGNQILSNVALRANIPPLNPWAAGGGISWWGEAITVSDNTIQGNTGNMVGGDGAGGGVALLGRVATVTNNMIAQNTAVISGHSASGGGVFAGYFLFQRLTLSNNWIMSNTTLVTGVSTANPQNVWSGGGGIFVSGYDLPNDSATISDNHIIGNVTVRRMTTSGAGSQGHAEGGGLHVSEISTTLILNNEVRGNVAVENLSLSGSGGWGGRPSGGGMYLMNDDTITVSNNQMLDNVTAKQQSVNEVSSNSEGGGLTLNDVNYATVSSNTISANVGVITGSIASNTGENYDPTGGGVTVGCWNRPNCNLSFIGNTVLNNVSAYSVTISGSNVDGGANGGGFSFSDAFATLQSNVISGNTSNMTGNGSGGGIQTYNSKLTMQGNRILGHRGSGGVGGIWAGQSIITSTNDIFARNDSGIGAGDDSIIRLINDTFYNNNGYGASIDGNGLMYVTNTIVYSHEVGLVEFNFSATLIGNYNLLSNTTNYEGGAIGSANDILNQNPLFVNVSNDNFHLTDASPGIDKGTSVGAPGVDFEGDSRPQRSGVDIGADETRGQNVYLPFIRKN